MQSVEASGATEAALLIAAVRSLRRHQTHLVDPHRSCLQLASDTVSTGEVAGVYEGVQPVRGFVGDLKRLPFVAELDHRYDRAERLVLRQLRAVVHVRKYG